MSVFPTHAKRTATPRQAIIISLTVLLGGVPAVFASNYFFSVPLVTAFLCYGFAVYVSVAVSWSYLDGKTRNAAIRGHNLFVIFAVCLFAILLLIQKEHEPIPGWAVTLFITAGVAGYSVAGFCAVKNFWRWRRGEFSNQPLNK
jgi:phosphatidylglycerophosphate synthase